MSDAPEAWPRPRAIAPTKAQADWNGDDWLICGFGHSSEDGKDWVLATDSVRASDLTDCYFPSDAKDDAEFLCRMLEAYRTGVLILTTASPEAFATLEPVQALIGAAFLSSEIAVGSVDPANEDDATGQQISEIEAIRLLTPSDALAALAAREAAAERRGWLAGMERAAGIVLPEDDGGVFRGRRFEPALREAQSRIRAEMEKEG